jgi:hypothetical protein
MTMILTIDQLATRYGMLPSEIMVRATTFDLVMMDAALGFQRHHRDRAEGVMPNYTEDDLLKIKEGLM